MFKLLRLFLFSLALGSLAACGQAPALQKIPPQALVLAFGDSVTYGTGAGAGEDWPTLLAAKTGWNIINAGVPGETAAKANGRLQQLLGEHQPALVLIEMGGNDFLQRTPEAQVKEHVRTLIQTARGSGAQVALIGVPNLSLLALLSGKPYDAAFYADLAAEEKVPLIADVFAAQLRDEALKADPIHPNANGYRAMAEGIYTRLRELKSL